MKKYLLIKSDEDGNPTTWLDETELQKMLEDPMGYCSVDTFIDHLPEKEDPNYWPDGIGLLLEVKVLTPKSVTKTWRLS